MLNNFQGYQKMIYKCSGWKNSEFLLQPFDSPPAIWL